MLTARSDSCLVSRLSTISASGSTGTGLKNCTSTTCCARLVAGATFASGIDEVLDTGTRRVRSRIRYRGRPVMRHHGVLEVAGDLTALANASAADKPQYRSIRPPQP